MAVINRNVRLSSRQTVQICVFADRVMSQVKHTHNEGTYESDPHPTCLHGAIYALLRSVVTRPDLHIIIAIQLEMPCMPTSNDLI